MKTRKYITNKIGILIVCLFLVSCTGKGKDISRTRNTDMMGFHAVAVIAPTSGNTAKGIVRFSEEGKGVRIVAKIKGLQPGPHGFHIHEYGDCSAGDATSAGSHFNPEHKDHGGPNSLIRHVGDLGNLVADKSGEANYERIDTVISFTGSHSIIGRSVVIHLGKDNFKTQPTGGAGRRIGCGIIGLSR